jgi:hypothetical protein
LRVRIAGAEKRERLSVRDRTAQPSAVAVHLDVGFSRESQAVRTRGVITEAAFFGQRRVQMECAAMERDGAVDHRASLDAKSAAGFDREVECRSRIPRNRSPECQQGLVVPST